MRYDIFTADSEDELTQEVNEAIGEGWEPIGGVSVTRWAQVDRKGYTESGIVLRQAMIRRSEP